MIKKKSFINLMSKNVFVNSFKYLSEIPINDIIDEKK